MTRPVRRRRVKPRMTADERLPGAFEGETVSRRRFMTGTAHSAGMIAAASFTLPALGFAIGPVFDRAADIWQEIGPLSRFTESNYTPVGHHLGTGHRRGGPVDRLRAQAQPGHRRQGEGPV